MRFTGLAAALAAILTFAPAAGGAQTIDSRTAGRMLFGTGWEVELGQADFIEKSMAKAIESQLRGQPGVGYYGAIAVSPGEPVSSNLNSIVANFHSPETAQAAALKDCNARRTSGGPCVVVASIVPKRYKPRDFTLSAAATQAFSKTYKKLDSPKGMAVSPATGAYGMDRGDGGRALAKCAAAAQAQGASDCRLVIFDN